MASEQPLVFAHYFPPYPISIDNEDPKSDYYERNYLHPDGESGQHSEYGGLLRDRPAARSPLPGDWQLADMVTEIHQAASMGIDGFTVDILSLDGSNWDRTLLLMKAAVVSGEKFVVVPNLDTTASAGRADPALIASRLAELYSSSAAYRLPSGEYLLSSFKAEGQPATWWQEIQQILAEKHGVTVALIAVFLNASEQNMEQFAPISYAFGNWGLRTVDGILSAPDYAAQAHELGKKWMAPVAIQDTRPRNGLYAEADNTETLRASWDRAVTDKADMVQLITWNDYSESTSFAPSMAHGWTFLKLNAYFLVQFKTGEYPVVNRDAVFITHRIQPFSANGDAATLPMSPTLGGATTPPRDQVEVLAMLTAPATATVKLGTELHTMQLPAGETVTLFPLPIGSVTVEIVRDGTTVLKLDSPYAIVATPKVQDLQYYAVDGVAR
ncbi:glycoside hydrolase family 71 protein [Homoserinimonas sp. OAct 916]|uniref:glycoside hydrolase family 71 protein n=1 Tax=Homoserinimonas sp. OAct 916 TaxID=2211450 RepID=UPI00130066D5|nr:glycoside hydrolase family 71 protein [Homoserinimonas sp. OAct 916]